MFQAFQGIEMIQTDGTGGENLQEGGGRWSSELHLLHLGRFHFNLSEFCVCVCAFPDFFKWIFLVYLNCLVIFGLNIAFFRWWMWYVQGMGSPRRRSQGEVSSWGWDEGAMASLLGRSNWLRGSINEVWLMKSQTQSPIFSRFQLHLLGICIFPCCLQLLLRQDWIVWGVVSHPPLPRCEKSGLFGWRIVTTEAMGLASTALLGR